MNKAVYKYVLDYKTDYPVVNLPYGSKILYAREQYEHICVWALVDTHQTLSYSQRFRVAGTGHPIDEENLEYIWSAHLDSGAFIVHVFLLQ